MSIETQHGLAAEEIFAEHAARIETGLACGSLDDHKGNGGLAGKGRTLYAHLRSAPLQRGPGALELGPRERGAGCHAAAHDEGLGPLSQIAVLEYSGLYDSLCMAPGKDAGFFGINPHTCEMFLLGMDGRVIPSPIGAEEPVKHILRHEKHLLVLEAGGRKVVEYSLALERVGSWDLRSSAVPGPMWLSPFGDGFCSVTKSDTIVFYDDAFNCVDRVTLQFGNRLTRPRWLGGKLYMIDDAPGCRCCVVSMDHAGRLGLVRKGVLAPSCLSSFEDWLVLGDVRGALLVQPHTGRCMPLPTLSSAWSSCEEPSCNGFFAHDDRFFTFVRKRNTITKTFVEHVAVHARARGGA